MIYGLFLVAAATTAAPRPVVQPASLAALKCISRLLETKAAVHSVGLYVIDDERSAVEFGFRYKDGSRLVADIMLLQYGAEKPTWEVIDARKNSGKTLDSTDDVLSGLDFTAQCHIAPGFDDTVPGPKPRSQWLRIDSSPDQP